MRGRLIQDQDTRVLQNDAGDGNALPLAAAQPVTSFANRRIITVRQPHDKIVNVGCSGRGYHLRFAGLLTSVKQVGANRVIKEVGILGNHADVIGE